MRKFFLVALSVTTGLALYLTSTSPLALGLCVALLICGVLGPRLHISPRWLAVISVAAITATFLIEFPLPRAHGFLFVPTVALAGGIFSCLGSCLLLLRVNSGWEKYIILATTTATMLTCGNTTYTFPYGYTVILYTLFLVLFLRGDTFKIRLSTIFTSALTIGLAMVFAFALSSSQASFRTFMSSFQFWSSSINFGDTAGIKPMSGPGGTKVLMRVFSDRPETHMACRRYTDYEEQKWKAVKGRADSPKPSSLFENSPSYFLRGPLVQDWATTGLERVEVTTLRPEALPLPLESRVVSALFQQVEITSTGDLLIADTGSEFDGSYRYARGPNPIAEDPELLKRCLIAKVDPYVTTLAQKTAGNGSDAMKALALQQFFQQNFEYGFGYPFDQSEDPVLDFLKERPAAHCEVYATCMTLMLRTVGIPARYVQGFVVREKNGWGGYWVSRERDAHAWVEVYLQGLGWVTVDPTPPTVTEQLDSGSNWSELMDVMKRGVQRIWALILKGPQALAGGLYDLLTDHFGKATLLILFLAGWRLRNRFRSRPLLEDSAESAKLHPQVLRMQALLNDYQIAAEVKKPKQITLLEWADAVEVGGDFLREYSRVRYSIAKPEPSDIQMLEAMLDGALSQLERIEP